MDEKLQKRLAKEITKAGGPGHFAFQISKTQWALARNIVVERPTVHTWLNGDKVSPRLAPAVSECTGIPLHQLRPDVYPAETPTATGD